MKLIYELIEPPLIIQIARAITHIAPHVHVTRAHCLAAGSTILSLPCTIVFRYLHTSTAANGQNKIFLFIVIVFLMVIWDYSHQKEYKSNAKCLFALLTRKRPVFYKKIVPL